MKSVVRFFRRINKFANIIEYMLRNDNLLNIFTDTIRGIHQYVAFAIKMNGCKY